MAKSQVSGLTTTKLDAVVLEETYTNRNGKSTTRNINIDSYCKGDSNFARLSIGRNGVLISKEMIPQVAEALTNLSFETSKTNTKQSINPDLASVLGKLSEQVTQIGKNQQKITKRLSKLEG